MAGLFSTLNASALALTAHSRALETTGNNLANVNNPHYARQRVVYSERAMVVTAQGAQSLGLQALGVQQLRDALLDAQLVREIGLGAAAETQLAAYKRAESALGQNIDGTTALNATGTTAAGGLAAALDDLFNAFQDLASRPTDTGARQTLLQKAAILTDTFNQIDSRLAQVQTDLTSQVETGTAVAGQLLQGIAELNAQITRFEVNRPGTAADLRDQRQAKLEELAKFMPVEMVNAGSGQVQLLCRGADGSSVLLVENGAVSGPVSYDGTDLCGGDPAVVLAPASGSLHGALAARAGTVQELRTALDSLARQTATSVNVAYDPSATPGGGFFAANGLTAGTIHLADGLTAATLRTGASGATGDNNLALAVAAVAGRSFSVAGGDVIDGTLGQFYAASVTRLGQALGTAQSRAEDQDKIEMLVRTQRDAVSGVSLDEEMADLVRYQRAFQASSRVFSIVDQLLDTVVNGLGR